MFQSAGFQFEKSGAGEEDIVARKGGWLVGIEVAVGIDCKSKEGSERTEPLEVVLEVCLPVLW